MESSFNILFFNMLFENKEMFCGISFLSSNGDKAYPQAPFTEVLTMKQIVEKYGEESLFTSALIEAGLQAFNSDLWLAIETGMDNGLDLTEKTSENVLQRDFVRRFKKFAKHFSSEQECGNCLKDTYNLHLWWKITNSDVNIDFDKQLGEKKYTDISSVESCWTM